jgi:hypothetical protein
VIWADRKFRLGYGRVLALYVMAYTAGRGWIEYLRIDEVQLDDVAGLRLNVWVSIALFVLAAAYFVWAGRRHPGREETVYVEPLTESGDAAESDEAVDVGEAHEAHEAGEADEADEVEVTDEIGRADEASSPGDGRDSPS